MVSHLNRRLLAGLRSESIKFWSLPLNTWLCALVIATPTLLATGNLLLAGEINSAHQDVSSELVASALTFSANALAILFSLLGLSACISDSWEGHASIWILARPKLSRRFADKFAFGIVTSLTLASLSLWLCLLTVASICKFRWGYLTHANLLPIAINESLALSGLWIVGLSIGMLITVRFPAVIVLGVVLTVLPSLGRLILQHNSSSFTSWLPMPALQAAVTIKPSRAFTLDSVEPSFMNPSSGLAVIWLWGLVTLVLKFAVDSAKKRLRFTTSPALKRTYLAPTGLVRKAKGYSLHRNILAELVKFFTLPGVWVNVMSLGLITLISGKVAASAEPASFGLMPHSDKADAVVAAHQYLTSFLAGSSGVGQITFAILGFQFYAGDRGSFGIIQAGLNQPNRLKLLAAKTSAAALASGLMSLIALIIASLPSFSPQSIKNWGLLVPGLPELQTLVTCASVYAASSLIGFFIGVTFRHVLVGIAVVLNIFVILPLIFGATTWLVSGTQLVWVANLHLIFPFAPTATTWLPPNAFIPNATSSGLKLLDKQGELVVFAIWVGALACLAVFTFARRRQLSSSASA